MAVTIPNGAPDVIIQGATTSFYKDAGETNTTDYTLMYSFGNGTESFNVTASAFTEDTFLVTIASGITSQFDAADKYYYTAIASHTSDGTACILDEGFVTVQNNYFLNPTFDGRSHAVKVLEALEAALEGRATATELGYSISTGSTSRSISKLTHTELIDAINRYGSIVKSEERKVKARQGKTHSGRIKLWF